MTSFFIATQPVSANTVDTAATAGGVSTDFYLVLSSNTSPAGVGPTRSATSYTFVTSNEIYSKIFSAQCARVSAFVAENLERLDRADDDYNENIIELIANVIDLVGEPAYGTVSLEAQVQQRNAFVFERLLCAIAESRHKDTEFYRLELLRNYAEGADFRTKRAAVRALGRMKTDAARAALNEIGHNKSNAELAKLATAYLD